MIPKHSLFWSFSHLLAYPLFKNILGLRSIEGKKNLPLDENFILAPNHLNNFDPPAAAFSVYPHECYFLAKKELFEVHPVYSFILKTYNAIKIDRTGKDISAMKKALKVLHKGHILIVFPEGTRKARHNFEDIKTGAAFLSAKTRKLLIPCFISYTNPGIGDLLRGKMETVIKFGRPISPTKDGKTKSTEVLAELWKMEMKRLCGS
ncbi:1-acyl-sn-glycerol-3-phosphate acyltransferase [candidate division WOR-3 bacterium]|nr:1-acyl-sn-glycerol-3-phosphate acyltransferase [candidate division WOR-3 bacterium]